MRRIHAFVGTAAIAAFAFVATATAGTLEDVKKRGVLRCVVSTGIAGFAYPDASLCTLVGTSCRSYRKTC